MRQMPTRTCLPVGKLLILPSCQQHERASLQYFKTLQLGPPHEVRLFCSRVEDEALGLYDVQHPVVILLLPKRRQINGDGVHSFNGRLANNNGNTVNLSFSNANGDDLMACCSQTTHSHIGISGRIGRGPEYNGLFHSEMAFYQQALQVPTM